MFREQLRKAGVTISAVMLVALVALPAASAPVRDAKAMPGDCTACHKAEKVLPAGHVATKDMKFEGCAQCHAPKSATALSGKMPSGHLHQLKGVGCMQCHGAGRQPTPVRLDQCVACHGSTAKLAEKTANVKPENPHDSPHWGTEMECNVCHHQHSKTENYCAYCHTYQFKVP